MCVEGVYGNWVSLLLLIMDSVVCIPLSCGMLVYKLLTSAVTRIAFSGSGGMSLIMFKKSFVSLMYAGSVSASGCMNCVI